MVVGAVDHNGRAGAVYLFTWNGTTWGDEEFIQPLTGLEAVDEFGRSVSISGNKLVVGAIGDDGASNSISNSGAVYTFLLQQTPSYTLSST